MYAVTREGGLCLGFPDVCLTPAPPGPAVPVPYVNLAQPSLGSPASMKVYIRGVPALSSASRIAPSSGDEPGTAGGVRSGRNLGKMQFTGASSLVYFEGHPAVRLGDPTRHNDGNAEGAVVQPCQTLVLILR